jgi:AbiV family abortive infection protein
MFKHDLLPQYKGQITPAQAADGIRVAEKNAKELLSDAELLLEHKRWPRACALAILAIEEAGKPPILRMLLLARNSDELKEGWREYRSHIKKNAMWIFSQLVADGARRLDDFRVVFDKNSDHASLLETIKQISLYSDACGDCHWSIPHDVIDAHLADALVSTARLLIQGQPSAMSSQAELEIWVKYMQPVWKQSMEQMEMALLACYNEAEEKGVLSGKHTAKDMAKLMGLDLRGEAG